MALKINKKYMTQNECYKEARKINPKGVMWHSTAAREGENANTDHYIDRWNKKGVYKCVHAFLDETDVTEMLPTERGNCYRGWHSGQGSKGSFNDTHIGFEIIEPKDYKDKEYFAKIYENAITYTVTLFERFGIENVTEENLLCHCEGHVKFNKASNHADVMHWFKYHGKTMDDVRKEVQKRLNKHKEMMKKKTDEVIRPSSSTTKTNASSTSKKQGVVATKPKTTTTTAYTTANLNCRVNGKATAKLVGTFAKSSSVTVTYAKGDTWYKTTGKDKNGKLISGYVNAKYLTFTNPIISKTMTTTTGLNCRNKNNTTGKIVGVFKKGTKVKVSYKKGDSWYKASGKDKTGKAISGYVCAKYLK